MPFRISGYARSRMRKRGIPLGVVRDVYDDPDGTYTSPEERHGPDREVRWRRYDGQVVAVVVDLVDGSVVTAWVTRAGAG